MSVAANDEPAGSTAGRLATGDRERLRLVLLRSRIKEFLAFDATPGAKLAGACAYSLARFLAVCGREREAFTLLSKIHRANWLPRASAYAERMAREAAAGARPEILSLYRDHIEGYSPNERTAKFFDDPTKMFGSIAMVLKSAQPDEKGVLLLLYSYTFPLFARRFDLDRVSARYHVVLEPDWSGFCDPNILSYSQFRFPVFVEAFEPLDAELIAGTRSNLIAVRTSTNWWVDHRLFRPLPAVTKDIDVVMVAAWGAYKRHPRFFEALARLRRRGRKLRALLLGYPNGLSKEDIIRQAAYFGVADQIEMHEWVAYERVNDFLNRAKVNVLWSRKEGGPRAIIEGMFAGLPCIVRKGFNYGYAYPYINAATGLFASEAELPEKLLWMTENHRRLSPREWVSSEMSCIRATEMLSEAIAKVSFDRGERWSGGLAVKVNRLHDMEYWDPENHARFGPDYDFLRSTLRR